MALINCPECGKEISDQAASCPNCGMPIADTMNQDEYLVCPKCKSKELHAEQNGFSGGKALAGALTVGGIGLLAGTIGSKDVNITCLKCGNRFKAGEALIVKPKSESDALDQQIASLLRAGEVVRATKVYQDATHANMTQSLEYINKVAAKEQIDLRKADKGGCASVILLLVLITSAVIYSVL